MTDNGKLKQKNQEMVIQLDEDTKKALAKDDSLAEINEPTKYILIDSALVQSVFDDRVKHFTNYDNRNEAILVDDMENHARLIPIVFKSKNEQVNQRIKNVAELFTKNVHDHADNMMAVKGFTAKLLAMMLRQDTNPLPSDKEIKKMFGRM